MPHCAHIIFSTCSDSLEFKLLDALDKSDRLRLQKSAGLFALPDRHVGCEVTAEVRDVSCSQVSNDSTAAASGLPFRLVVWGCHRAECATTLRSVQHLDQDVRTWCVSLTRLGMNQTRIHEAMDDFLLDRAAFAGYVASLSIN